MSDTTAAEEHYSAIGSLLERLAREVDGIVVAGLANFRALPRWTRAWIRLRHPLAFRRLLSYAQRRDLR